MSIKEIEKNKKYKITIFKGKIGNKQDFDYYTFYGTKRDAKLKEAEYYTQLKKNTYISNNNMNISTLCDEYLKYKKDKVSIKTYDRYECVCRIYIKECIGHIKLRNLSVKLLEDFYQDLKENTTLSSASLKKIYQIVNNMLICARKWGYITINANENIDAPKTKKREMEYYTPEEVQALLKALEFEPIKYQALLYLALDSGARRGELTGLTWEDIDFENSTIDINKITQYTKGHGIYEKEPKSLSSYRKIKISQTTLKILKAYEKNQLLMRMRLGSKWGNSKRVFTTDYGYDMHPDTPSSIFDKVIEKHNLKSINFHGLRHTSISLLINKGIPIQLISKRAGHSNTGITYNTYSHFFDDSFDAVADTMDEYLKDNVN